MVAQKKSEPATDAPALPKIDQESMTSAVADEVRPDAAENAEDDRTNVVRYLGIVSERRITREDWEQAGVSDQDGVVWTKGMENAVPIEQFSEEALRVISNQGSEFRIVRDQE